MSDLIAEAERWASEEDPENARILRRLIARAKAWDSINAELRRQPRGRSGTLWSAVERLRRTVEEADRDR